MVLCKLRSIILTNAYSLINYVQSYRQIINLPWILMGDFNLFGSVDETTGEIKNIGNTMIDFNRFIEETSLAYRVL